jgi:hypothetical protein
MSPELEYIAETLKRQPRDYRVMASKTLPDTVLVKCPDGTWFKIIKANVNETQHL